MVWLLVFEEQPRSISLELRASSAVKENREYRRDPRAEDRADNPVEPLIDLAETRVKAVKPTVDRIEPLIDLFEDSLDTRHPGFQGLGAHRSCQHNIGQAACENSVRNNRSTYANISGSIDCKRAFVARGQCDAGSLASTNARSPSAIMWN